MQIQDIKRIGIQGGAGSFNDQVLHTFLTEQRIDTHLPSIDFLFTTPRVLAALRDQEIDAGQFAVHNTIDGPVQRSIDAMADFQFARNFSEVARYSMQISHCLMIHPDATLSDVKTIVSHPTVFIQCKQTLLMRFSNLELLPGEGDLEDPARAGEAIARGELPMSYATLSSRRIAELFGLKIAAENLQDQNPNVSSFILAVRREDTV